jgi:ABC-type nitrate/sulfonate/bicarbonate transport system substrate-binding protein
VKVTWVTVGSGSALNDALLSESLQIAVGGTPSLITLWSKTRGGMGVRGIASMSAIPMYLNSSNPAVKTIADFTTEAQDRAARQLAKQHDAGAAIFKRRCSSRSSYRELVGSPGIA